MFSLYNGINSETNNRTICGKYLNIWKLNNTFLNDSEIKEETNKKLGSMGQEDPLKKKRQPTPVFLPRKSHGWRGLVAYSPWGRKESDTTEHNDNKESILS